MKELRIKSNKSFRINKIAIIIAILSLQIIFLVVLPIRGDSGSMGVNLFLTETGGDDVSEEEPVELEDPAEPMVFEGNVDITTPDMSYEGPAEFHILEDEVSLQFDEELINWNSCVTQIGVVLNHIYVTEILANYRCQYFTLIVEQPL